MDLSAPISTLPPEILLEIFAYCVSNESLAPLGLRRVSWWWRGLVDTSPRLWQRIVLKDSDIPARFSEQQAQLWTQRSMPLKYDVELEVEDPDQILSLVSPLLSSIHRWQSFQLSGRRDEEVDLDDLDLSPDTLTHLQLCLLDYDSDFDDEEPRVTFTPTCPGSNDGYALNIWLSKIPAPQMLPQLRFVHVTIAEGGQTGLHTQPKYILDFLNTCPELESFFLSGWIHDEPIIGPLPLIRLPNLVTLHLRRTCFARAFLSSLVTPRLENLLLSHLNVDFSLINYYEEDGDSDDEARDFSQSPWSDQATGMGLRKLIINCRPPIRILSMDFCDMRTKDFHWIFDRLPLLEDFHIVASDMSDKVMNLFRPIQPKEDDPIVRLRLPHLGKIKLTNCQRLSGAAIVEALSERVKWTDVHYPDYTLQDVVVSGCDGFSTWDRHVLSSLLGRRLRT
ncbi:hypothetical protein BJ165DRAFT_1345202 [Panaeolus papilionaceus]|nr:hypothetical protein BJ165DRAFT_1345202 [Panaeolus papilionaceus]